MSVPASGFGRSDQGTHSDGLTQSMQSSASLTKLAVAGPRFGGGRAQAVVVGRAAAEEQEEVREAVETV